MSVIDYYYNLPQAVIQQPQAAAPALDVGQALGVLIQLVQASSSPVLVRLTKV